MRTLWPSESAGWATWAIQCLSALTGATITALDTRQESLDLAIECGAHHTVLSTGEDVAAQVKDITKGRGAEVVIDFVGVDATIALAVSLGRIRGDVTIVGAAGGTFAIGIYSAPYEMTMRSTLWGTRSELREVMELAALGKIKPVYEEFSLTDSVLAYKRLQSNAVRGRAVVVPTNSTGRPANIRCWKFTTRSERSMVHTA